MPPVSSLIFVVILAVWAVYLVQHWVRRRDHLATARSVDRFSESMRVLERRRALPRPDLVEHAPPSTSVLLRPARPEVVVKRGASVVLASARPVTAAQPVTASQPAARSSSPAPRSRPVATAVGPTPSFRRARVLARLRAAGLAAGSALLITLVVLTVAQVLHWGWSFAGLAVLAGIVAALRWSVSSSAAAGRRRATGSGTTARRRTVRRPAARPVRTGESAQQPGGARRSPLAAQARAAVGAPSTPARRAVDLDRRPAPVLYDIDQVETELAPATAAASHVPAPAEEPVSGSWSPVPVPPPTYTLKARAQRGAVPTTGSTQLPLDGTEMALDEEFEDLPSVDRVG